MSCDDHWATFKFFLREARNIRPHACIEIHLPLLAQLQQTHCCQWLTDTGDPHHTLWGAGHVILHVRVAESLTPDDAAIDRHCHNSSLDALLQHGMLKLPATLLNVIVPKEYTPNREQAATPAPTNILCIVLGSDSTISKGYLLIIANCKGFYQLHTFVSAYCLH